ncbi:VOC family protein [Paracoccus aestuariivivens]|uniref:Glyoxalase/bleomycin resistance/extradiol dioxygenase family protein n=1 Tax=Paracoccus aestuariivivens TaxID=1820333 RepID=A0A6L6JE07_9RHOB|nr:VOC family protein [Paracoccus aestuariivivens]MTH78827.1 glyoxalase/bleomycin resistance/extradiol dioxygenase family protein [Paracoccus aestuariivivens]
MRQPPPIIGTLETALYARDLVAASDFWVKIMGLQQIAYQPGRHVFFRCGAQILLVFDPDATRKPPAADSRLPVPSHGTDGEGHFCIAIDGGTILHWRDHLTANGVAIEADFEWPQGGRSIYFRDPAGNSIELAEPRIWNKE